MKLREYQSRISIPNSTESAEVNLRALIFTLHHDDDGSVYQFHDLFYFHRKKVNEQRSIQYR